MKALTICQPYAHLIIVTREKLVENREWPTRYRGPLLIHAGKSRSWLEGATDAELLREFGVVPDFGAVIGKADLIDCLHIDEIRAGKHDEKHPWLREHRHANGTWCWVLANPEHFAHPVPYRGQQGLFDIEWSAA